MTNPVNKEKNTIRGYLFEPTFSAAEIASLEAYVEKAAGCADKDLDGSDSEENSSSFCCMCGKCGTMSAAEQKCCSRYRKLQTVLGDTGKRCVTDVDYFATVCLDTHVLYAALITIAEYQADTTPQYGSLSNKSFRHAAYVQYVRLFYGRLGANRRLILPACVVTKVRNTFPETDGIYVGFKRSPDGDIVRDYEVDELQMLGESELFYMS